MQQQHKAHENMHKVDQTLTLYKKSFLSKAKIITVQDPDDVPRNFRPVLSFEPIEGMMSCSFADVQYTDVEWVNDLEIYIGQDVRLYEPPMYSFLECIRRATPSYDIFFVSKGEVTVVFMCV